VKNSRLKVKVTDLKVCLAAQQINDVDVPISVAEQLEEEIDVQIGVKMSLLPQEACLSLGKHGD